MGEGVWDQASYRVPSDLTVTPLLTRRALGLSLEPGCSRAPGADVRPKGLMAKVRGDSGPGSPPLTPLPLPLGGEGGWAPRRKQPRPDLSTILY